MLKKYTYIKEGGLMDKIKVDLNKNTTKVELSKHSVVDLSKKTEVDEADVDKAVSITNTAIAAIFIILVTVMIAITIKISHRVDKISSDAYYTEFIVESLDCSKTEAKEIINLVNDNGISNIVAMGAYPGTDKVLLEIETMNNESIRYYLVYENSSVSALLKLDSENELEILYTIVGEIDYSYIEDLAGYIP